MLKKYFLIVLFLAFLSAPEATVFADSPPPLDARCFTQSECSAAREKMGLPVGEQVQGFYNNTPETRQACMNKTDTAGQELGFCLPAGQTATSVKFGGATKFANIGIFIQYIYRYGIIFAGLLAVIVIIVSGLQWTASGGNSSTIESAKTRISGAITGLILASASYIILNTLNPSTINLRLPQVWLLREQALIPENKYCMQLLPTGDAKSGFVAAKVAPYDENYTGIAPEKFKSAYEISISSNPTIARYENVFPNKTETNFTPCGQKFTIEKQDGASCLGTYCPDGQACVNDSTCEKVNAGPNTIAGTITQESGKWLYHIYLKVACSEPGSGLFTIKDVDSTSPGRDATNYKFEDVASSGESECGGADKVGGYFFQIEAHDSDFMQSLNNSDDWMGGKSFCNNMSHASSCGYMGEDTISDDDAESQITGLALLGDLFKPEDLAHGIWCNFLNNTEGMPNIGEGLINSDVSAAAGLVGLQGKYDKLVGNVDLQYGAENEACPLHLKQQQFYDILNKKKK